MTYNGLLIDLDGVVWRGPEPVPGVPNAIAELVRKGTRVQFLTNNPRADANERADRLNGMGIPCSPEQVTTAGRATLETVIEDLFRRDNGSQAPASRKPSLYMVGNESFRRQASEHGFAVAETPPLPVGDIGMPKTVEGADSTPKLKVDAVIVSGHAGFDYAELKGAFDAIRAGASLYAVNRDNTGPMPDGPWPGTGAVLAAVEAASGVTATVCGKPEQAIFRTAVRRLNLATSPKPRIAMVGDRLVSDIQGAQNAGLEAILVLGGDTTREDLVASDIAPDLVLESLADLTN